MHQQLKNVLLLLFFGLYPKFSLSEILELPQYSTDLRLMQQVSFKAKLTDELSIYEWDWNNLASYYGLDNQPSEGLIADEVKQYYPTYVVVNEVGLLEVEMHDLIDVDQRICEFLMNGGTPYCWQIGR